MQRHKGKSWRLGSAAIVAACGILAATVPGGAFGQQAAGGGSPQAGARKVVHAPCGGCGRESPARGTSHEARPADPQKPPVTAAPAPRIRRWIDLQTASVAVRHRYVDNTSGVVTARQMQYTAAFKGAFNLDSRARYGVVAGAFSGSSFTGGWNTTGVGTGSRQGSLYLKQFYATATPVNGITGQYGSLAFARGESTEATTWDNDAYVVGERVSVKRPGDIFFDEITFTEGYVGDFNRPSFLERTSRLGDRGNYRQFLLGKKIGKGVSVSADYSSYAGVRSAHAGIKVATRPLQVVDWVRFETYERLNVNRDRGFLLHGEKAVSRKLTLGAGYVDIDLRYGTLNGDRFSLGRHAYMNGAFGLTRDLTVQLFATQAVGNDATLSLGRRFELILNYNLLGTLKAARLF